MNYLKTNLWKFKTAKTVNVTSGSDHVTPNRLPFAVNLALKVSIVGLLLTEISRCMSRKKALVARVGLDIITLLCIPP